MRTCAWAAIVGEMAARAWEARCRSSSRREWAQLVRGGMELGHAMDAVTGEHNVKQGVGAVGILTAGS